MTPSSSCYYTHPCTPKAVGVVVAAKRTSETFDPISKPRMASMISLNLGFYHSSTYQSLSNHHWLSYLFTLGKEHALLSRPNTISPVLYIVSVFNLHFLKRHH